MATMKLALMALAVMPVGGVVLAHPGLLAPVDAVSAMLGRLLGQAPGGEQLVPLIGLELAGPEICRSGSHGCFELVSPPSPGTDAGGAVVIVRGSSTIDLAAGAGWYLRHIANTSFSCKGPLVDAAIEHVPLATILANTRSPPPSMLSNHQTPPPQPSRESTTPLKK